MTVPSAEFRESKTVEPVVAFTDEDDRKRAYLKIGQVDVPQFLQHSVQQLVLLGQRKLYQCGPGRLGLRCWRGGERCGRGGGHGRFALDDRRVRR